MRQSRSDRGAHLVENYNVPDGAQTIIPQTREEEALRRSSATKMPSRVGGGVHRFRNTLDERRYTGNMGNGVNKNSANRGETVVRRLPHPSLELSRSRGTNVPPSRELRGDGFRHEQLQPSKRQKLSNGKPSSVPSKQHIDLTEDDSQQDNFGELKGWSTRNDAMNGIVLQPSPSLDETVARKVHKWTEPEPVKRKRKDRGSQGSSQTSTRATPNDVQNPLQSSQKTVRQSPAEVVPIDDRDEEVLVVSQSAQTKPYNSEVATKLTNGARTLQHQTIALGSNADIKGSVNVLKSASRRRPDPERPHDRQDPTQEEAGPNKRRSIQQSDGILVPQITQQRHERTDAPLRKIFVRDNSEEQQRPGQRHSQRMKATSELPRSSFSEDELAGGNTIASQTSRSMSPRKVRTTTVNQARERHETTPRREPSPADLKPTDFYSSGRQNSKAQSRNEQAERFDEVRIPVERIFCRACCLQQKKIELVWDEGLKGFSVQCDGVPLHVPNKSKLMCIGSSEAAQWTDAEQEGLPVVHIKGSQNENSNGSIIIGFADLDGLSTCYEFLLHARNQTLKTISVPKKRMEDLVKRQGSDILADHKKYSQPRDHKSVEIAAIQRRKNNRKIRQPFDPDGIQYEDDNPPIRQSARSPMQAGTSNGDETSRIRSKHFKFESNQPDQLDQPRRSSRQTKAAKAKSQSPPPPVRWTRQNKLERWSHSVIYPPEGATRRVTVDFQDLERLDEGEFLNDNIIGFALRRIEENMAPEHKENVMFFNSFFYTALTTKSGKKAFNYDAVKRWTKTKDLFSFPYIVVPINIDLHWFVEIICNLPNLSRKASALDDEPDDGDEMLINELECEREEQLGSTNETAAVDSDTATNDAQKSMRHLSLSDDDTNSGFNKTKSVKAAEDVHDPPSSRPSTASGKKSKKKVPPRQRTFDPDAPSIITLDSFGSTHSVTTRILKDYLNAEAEAKRGMEVTKEDLQGMNAKGIPEQTNFCDCGVYVVGYVEEFAKDPRKFVNKVLLKQLDRESDFASFNPSAKRAEIRDELLKLHKEQESERKAKKIAKKPATAVNGEASKVGEAPLPAKAQTDNETTTMQGKDPFAFVPLNRTSVDPAETATSGQDEANNATANTGSDNAESDELELGVPRPLENSRPRLFLGGDVLAPSSHTEVAMNGDNEGSQDKIDNSNSNFEQARSEPVAEDLGSDILNEIDEYLGAE